MNTFPDRKLSTAVNDAINGGERYATTSTDLWREPTVQRARLGDTAAFERLMKDNFQRVYRTALRIVGDPSDAEDIAQETFLRAYRCLGQFKGKSKFSTWLTRIAVNQSLMHLRKNRNRRGLLPLDTEDGTLELELPDHRPTPEQACGSSELHWKISRAVSRLPASLRLAFEVRHFHELTTEETAIALRISVPAAKSRVLRACKIIRERLHYSAEIGEGNGSIRSETSRSQTRNR